MRVQGLVIPLMALLALAAACGEGGSPPAPSPGNGAATTALARTPDPGAAEAIERVVRSQPGSAWAAGEPGEEFACEIVPSGAVEDVQEQFPQVSGVCTWEAERIDDGWIVTFEQKWDCRDFSGAEIGFQPCSGEASYNWWHLIDEDGEVTLAEHGGNFPPWARP